MTDDDTNDFDIVDTGFLASSCSPAAESLQNRPIYITAQLKERVTRDGRISLRFLVLSGCSDKDGVTTRLITQTTLELNFTWPAVLLDNNKLTSSKMSLCTDLDERNATLLGQ